MDYPNPWIPAQLRYQDTNVPLYHATNIPSYQYASMRQASKYIHMQSYNYTVIRLVHDT